MPEKPTSPSGTDPNKSSAYDMLKEMQTSKEKSLTVLSVSDRDGGGKVAVTHNKSKDVSSGRVVGHHILNFLTLGLSGAEGSLCAKSQAIGSQKVKSIRGFGTSILEAPDAPSDAGATGILKYKARPGSISNHDLLSKSRLLKNSLEPDMCRFRAQFGEVFSIGNFTQFRTNTLSGSNAPRTRGEILQSMKQELIDGDQKSRKLLADKPAGTRDYVHSPHRVGLSSGSASVKAMFLVAAKKEFCSENVLFLDWSSKVLDKADPDSLNYDPHYRLSKRELLDAMENYLASDSIYHLNLSSLDRQWVEENIDPQDPQKMLGDYLHRLRQAIDNYQSQKPSFDQAKRNLEQLENETFDEQTTRILTRQILSWDQRVLNNSAAMYARAVGSEFTSTIGLSEQELLVLCELQ